ncbi:MAG: c-type cytochrome [Thermoleophilaceae bacterium]|nr:c-type cytochrome [Thermoleophilaceae bacterium]
MHKRPQNTAKKTLALAAVMALSIVVSGCGNDSKTDLANGKTLFIAKCGGCHTMARANTVGTQGPDIDDSFRQAREDGMGDTIQGVVEGQIKYPSQKLYPSSLVMPPNLVTGMDVNDVAAYVSYAAANPGKDSGALADIGGGTDGKGIFKTNCGSCHTLADAGTVGTTGPNLDQRKAPLARVLKQVTNGGNGMPAFGGTLTPEQIKLVSEYVAKVDGSQ